MLSRHTTIAESLPYAMDNEELQQQQQQQLALPQTVANVLAYTPLTTLTSILPVLNEFPDGEIGVLPEQEEDDTTFNDNTAVDLNSISSTILDDIVTRVKLIDISGVCVKSAITTRPDPAITTTDLPVLPARSSIVQSVLDQLQPVTLDGAVKTNDILDNNDDVMLNEPPLDWIQHWCNEIQSESMSLLDEEHLSASNTAVNDTDIPMTMDTHLESVKEESTNPRTLVVDDYKHPVNITVQPAVDKLSEFLKRLFASQDALEQQQQQQQNTTAYVVSSIDNTLFTRDGPSNDEQKSQQWILSASSVQQLYYMCHHSHLSTADVNDVTSAITSYTQLFLQYPIISDLSRLEHLLEQVIQQGETCALMLLESTVNDSALNRAWSLNQLNTGIQAVLCVLAIMTQSGSLHPRLYPEELILGMIRLTRLVQRLSMTGAVEKDYSDQWTTLMISTGHCIQGFERLVRQQDMSEQVIILSSYTALSGLFQPSLVLSVSSYLILPSLELLCTIFHRYTAQRVWLLDEVLSHSTMNRSETPLSTDATMYRITKELLVHRLSVLLLRFIQSSHHHHHHHEDQASLSNNNDNASQSNDDNIVMIMNRMEQQSQQNMKSTFHYASVCINHLLQRESGFDIATFITDLFKIRHLPEWPGAHVTLLVLSKQLHQLWLGENEDKQTCDNEDKPAMTKKQREEQDTRRGMALEQLTRIYVEIYANKEEDHDEQQGVDTNGRSLELIMIELNRIKECQQQLFDYYYNQNADNKLETLGYLFANLHYFHLRSYLQACLASDNNSTLELKELISSVLKPLEQIINRSYVTRSVPVIDSHEIQSIWWQLTCDWYRWNPSLFHIHSLAFPTYSSIPLRIRGLKALETLLTTMPATIDQSLWSSWLQTVIDHLQDTVSIGIRDTALGIIGQLCLTRDDPVLLQQCYPLIQARVMDVGVSVRKHAIRLLKDIYAQVEDESIKTNIALCLLHQIEDVDPSIIKLCHQQLQSIWLSDLSLVSASITTSNQASTLHSGYHHLTTSDQILLKDRLHIMGQSMKQCATTYRYRLAKVFEKALDTTSRNRKARTQLYQWYVHWYMEQLLSTTTESVSYGYDLVLVQLARVVPELFIYHLPNLCLYISSITYQEYDLAESIIHIIRSTLPVLRQIDSKLMLTLQSNLTNLLLKGSQSLIELAVPCLCMIITRYTRQHMYLLRLWTASIKRITDEEVYYQEKRTFQSLRHLLRLLLAIGLICLHYRVTDTRPIELAKQCSLLKEKTFHLVIRFMHQPYEPSIQTYALKSMGYLYQAYPAWLTNEQSTSIIQRILTNNDQIMIRVQLMKVFTSLLSSSLEGQEGHDDKTTEKQEAIFMHTQLEDDGLTPGLIHKYVDAILEATLHQHPLLHETAFQVIRLALQQGIIHPFKCMPAVVAVMASPYKKVRQCAIDLFALMDGKHASFLYQRLNEYIEALFVYRHRCCISLGVQSELTGLFGPEEIGPTSPRPEPVTASLYRFVQSRKAHCSSLIKLMVERIKKCNDTTLTSTSTSYNSHDCCMNEIELSYTQFVATQLATLSYQSIDEVMIVVNAINQLISSQSIYLMEQSSSHVPSVEEARCYLGYSSILYAKKYICTRFCLRNASSFEQVLRDNDRITMMAPFTWQGLLLTINDKEQRIKQREQFEQLLDQDVQWSLKFKQLSQIKTMSMTKRKQISTKDDDDDMNVTMKKQQKQVIHNNMTTKGKRIIIETEEDTEDEDEDEDEETSSSDTDSDVPIAELIKSIQQSDE